MEKVADEKTGAWHTAPIVAVFKQKIEETLKRLAEGGRTSALWVHYHYMVDVIKIFIRTEWFAGTCPALSPGFWTPLQLEGIINMPRVHGSIVN